MVPITKLLKKTKTFEWIVECQIAWKEINNGHIQVPILINPQQELKFHVHINASQVVIGTILAHNPTNKFN